MADFGWILQIIVIAGFAIWTYSVIKGISVKEAMEEIKELIKGFKDGN